MFYIIHPKKGILQAWLVQLQKWLRFITFSKIFKIMNWFFKPHLETLGINFK